MSQQQNKETPPAKDKRTRRGTQAAGGRTSSRQQGAAQKAAPAKPAPQKAAPANEAPAKKQNTRRPSTGNTNRRRSPGQKAPELRIYPLGGLGEIGKNMTVYECGEDMIILDVGSLFPDSEMFGIDLVIPDFTFVEQNRDKIRGVVITHGHEDHIGALPYFLREMNLPVYATRLTIGLIENKLEEHGLKSSAQLNLINPGQKFKLGCFSIDPINVNHSIPDAVGFAVECPAGVIIHTGDFKIDYTPISGEVTDLAKLADYGKKGVLALLSDSTNAERPGMSASESKVNENLKNLFMKAGKQRIIIATFASNIYRVQHIIDLAIAAGRKVAVSGRSMLNNVKMAIELGYITAADGVLVDVEKINSYRPEDIVLITTGSQGEPLSALSRMSMASHRSVRVNSGDFIIISATPIPGNEKMVTKVVNGLLRLGADVYYERMYEVHASGHACQEEQKLVINLVKPKYFIPVHGEYKHLKRHAQLAESLGVPPANILIADTGDTIVLSQSALKTAEPVPSGAVMVDGLGVGDVGSVVLRDRRLLSEDGIVVLAASVDKKTGKLVSGPELFSRGFVYVRESEELLEETRLAVQKVLQNNEKEPHRDIGSLKTRIREAAASLLYRKTKRSPMILPVLMEVDDAPAPKPRRQAKPRAAQSQ